MKYYGIHKLTRREAVWGVFKHPALKGNSMYGKQHFTVDVFCPDGSRLRGINYYTHKKERGRADAFTKIYRFMYDENENIGRQMHVYFDEQNKHLVLVAA